MTTYEDMHEWPSAEVKNASGAGWVMAHPLPDYLLSRRLRDAWEVFMGRAIAVRQATAEDAERLWMLRKPSRNAVAEHVALMAQLKENA